MKLRACLSLAMITAVLTGCAGGWRNGAPAGTNAMAAPAGAAAAAPAKVKGAAKDAAKTAAAATTAAVASDGARFVYKGEAKSVNVAGEFNAWNTSADALTKQADGSWVLVKKLEPGKYAYKFVIDGGTWKADDLATETMDDGYGGKNSVVVVGGAAGAAAASVTVAPAKAVAAPAAAGATTGDGARFVYKGEAKSVNVAGEFNAWNTSADALTKLADGSWVLVKKLDPGKYAYKFVIDGGTWKADDNATETIDDGYGGKNSVVVVGAAAGAATSAAAPAAAAATPVAANTVNGKGAAPVVTADGVRFTYAGAATQVNLAGDFNSWSTSSDALKVLADGTWTITRKIAAGTYGYKFLINGKTWKQDESNPEAKDDGFGGKNSIVTIK